MPELNLKTLQESKDPIILSHENGKNGIAVNYSIYENLGAQEKYDYRQKVYEYTNSIALSADERASIIRDFQDAFARVDSGRDFNPVLTGAASVVKDDYAFFEFSTRELSLENRIQVNVFSENAAKVKVNLAPRKDEMIAFYAIEHEKTHVFKGLKEAGSDYLAALEVRRAYPDAKTTLQYLADERVTEAGVIGVNPLGGDRTRTYGYPCFLAFRAAMALSTDEIKNMTAEQALEKAREFDDLTDLYRSPDLQNQTEIKVMNALRTNQNDFRIMENARPVSPGIAMTSGNPDYVYRLSKNFLEKHNPFPEHSPEDEMLHDFVDAMKRMAETGYDPIASIAPSAPALAAKPAR